MSKVIIGPGRLSFPNVFTAKKNDSGEDKFSVAILLPPDYDTTPLIKALTDAAVTKWGSDKAKWPKGIRGPNDVIRDCDEKDQYAEFPGWKFINLSASSQPGVVDGNLDTVTDASEVYPGRWAKISAAAFAYQNKTKGVSLGLNNIQVLKHDTALGGKGRAANDFDAVAADMATTDAGNGWD